LKIFTNFLFSFPFLSYNVILFNALFFCIWRIHKAFLWNVLRDVLVYIICWWYSCNIRWSCDELTTCVWCYRWLFCLYSYEGKCNNFLSLFIALLLTQVPLNPNMFSPSPPVYSLLIYKMCYLFQSNILHPVGLVEGSDFQWLR
jgi:hypothetical protein